MKKFFFLIPFLFFIFHIFPHTLILKEKILVSNKKITLHDIIKESSLLNIPDVLVANIEKFPKRLSAKKILESLFSKGIFDLILIGKEIIIDSYKKDNTILDSKLDTDTHLYKPIEFLEKYLESYLDKNNFMIKINLIKIEPYIDLSSIKDDFLWEINRLNYGLKDFEKIKKIPITIKNNKYYATIDINIFANIWITNQSFLKNDFLKKEGFYKKHVDITAFKKIDSLVFDITKTKNTQFTKNIGTGEALRWTVLKKIPILKKGESIKLIVKRSGIEITIPCIAIKDAFENEKIKVKLINGKEKFGVLRYNKGLKYVEIL